MAFGVSPKVSHDISSAFGKGLHGLKVEAMANQRTPKKGPNRKGLSGRALVETVMLGVFTIAVAAIPVILARVPAPESLIIVKELLQDWCTPSICFVVLIVGVMIATSGVWGSDAGTTTPEQNHKTFAESYLTQGPVSATQMDPLRMPDIFFSADAARAHSLNHSAAFPVRVAAQPTSVMVPVYYPALIPPQPSSFSHKSEKDVDAERFLPRFGPNVGDRFMPQVEERFMPHIDDRFVPRVDVRFSPRVEERFSPRVEERFLPKGEERFGPRMDERFSPRVEEMYVPHVEERYVPQVEERYVPQVEERYVPHVEERYVPQVEERYVPEMEERYESLEQDRFETEEDTYEPEEESRYDAHVETTTGRDDDFEARSESEDEGRYEPVEEMAHTNPEDEVESECEEREYVESEADEAEPQVELRSEDEFERYPHESYDHEDDEQSLPEVVSPPHFPVEAPPAIASQLPHSQKPSDATGAPDAEPPVASLLSRRKPPTVPTPVIVRTAPPPPPPPVVSAESPSTTTPVAQVEPKMSVRVERVKETPETNRPSVMSPRTPPGHASGRRPLSSSSSRSYAEFVRRSSNFSPRTPLDPPRPPCTPKPPSPPKPEAVAVSSPKAVEAKAGRSSTSPVRADRGSALMKQLSMPARRPREVRVVDDDKLDDNEETQGPGEDDDVDQRVEAFLKNFREQMRLQRQESLQRHKRGVIDP